MIKAELMRNGVDESAITVIADEVEAVNAGLECAEAGDLLVIFGDDSARCWKQIIYFNSDDEEAETEAPGAKPAVVAEFEELYDTDQTLIRDERGVRLARETSEDAD